MITALWIVWILGVVVILLGALGGSHDHRR